MMFAICMTHRCFEKSRGGPKDKNTHNSRNLNFLHPFEKVCRTFYGDRANAASKTAEDSKRDHCLCL